MPVVVLFGLTIFTSAALLFALEPLFARMVLPLLGGTPAVWNTCLLFFQTVLLAGYAYAHFVARRLSPRSQAVWHPLLLLLPLLLLPFGIPAGWSPPTEQTPVPWLLGLMTVSIGAPFLAVSATTPLLQKWFASTPHPSSHDPYFLYGASNLGSMIALLSYPLLIEPNLGLAEQSRWWTVGYAVLALLMIGCAAVVWRNSRESRVQSPGPEENDAIATEEGSNVPPALDSRLSALDSAALHPQPSTLDPQPTGWRQRLWWIALAFVPSSWLLGLTTFLTTDISPVPLLWVAPLSLYLLSFILVFARRPLLRHEWMTRLFPWMVMLLAIGVVLQASWPLMLLHAAAFFVGCMVCHGELAARRPAVSHLTEFYFWLSFGGVLGGAFNALAAPLLFDRPLEYPLTLLAACLLRRRQFGGRAAVAGAGGWNRRPDLVLLGLFAATAYLVWTNADFRASDLLLYAVFAAVPVLILSTLLDLTYLFAAGAGAVLLFGAFDHPFGEEILANERSFYGVHRVVADADGMHWLLHGVTAHGVQSRAIRRRCVPLAYYHQSGPLGDVFAAFRGARPNRNVALVGLGSGAAICYQQPGERFTFYEIDPVVKQLAETPEYFSYLSECSQGEYEIVLGDGRLQLAKAADGEYGMIFFDAFSSDAIPVHLLTREAFRMYLEKLTDDGLLVFHITNSHLDLEPVIANLAADAGLAAYIRNDLVSDEVLKFGRFSSTYMVVARQRSDLRGLADRPGWSPSRPTNGGEVWRDDYSNVVGILNWFR